MSESRSILAEALCDLEDREVTTIKQLAEASGYARTTVRDWMVGGARIPADAVQSLIQRHPSREVRAAVLAVISGGTATLEPELGDLDLNGDGRVDAADAMSAAVVGVQSAGVVLASVHEALRADVTPAPSQIAAATAQIRNVREHAAVAEQVLLRLTTPERRKART